MRCWSGGLHFPMNFYEIFCAPPTWYKLIFDVREARRFVYAQIQPILRHRVPAYLGSVVKYIYTQNYWSAYVFNQLVNSSHGPLMAAIGRANPRDLMNLYLDLGRLTTLIMFMDHMDHMNYSKNIDSAEEGWQIIAKKHMWPAYVNYAFSDMKSYVASASPNPRRSWCGADAYLEWRGKCGVFVKHSNNVIRHRCKFKTHGSVLCTAHQKMYERNKHRPKVIAAIKSEHDLHVSHVACLVSTRLSNVYKMYEPGLGALVASFIPLPE